jgi:hypothetical protein
MRLVASATVVLLCSAGWIARAQGTAAPPSTKTMLVEPPAPLLPATLGKLPRVADGDVGDGLGRLDAAGLSVQDKAAVTEDGLKRFAQSDYEDGAEHGTVSVFRFVDVSGAIAAFDYFRRPGPLAAAKMGDQTAADSNGMIVFRSGANIVREKFNLHGEHVGLLMGELIDHLPKVSGTVAMQPLLPSLVPAKVRQERGGGDGEDEEWRGADAGAVSNAGDCGRSSADDRPGDEAAGRGGGHGDVAARGSAGGDDFGQLDCCSCAVSGGWDSFAQRGDVRQADAGGVSRRGEEDVQPANEHHDLFGHRISCGAGAGAFLWRRTRADTRVAGQAGGQRAGVSAHRSA